MTDNNIVIASAKVDIKIHPELRRLYEEGETIEDLLRLTPDQTLLCWFNYDLKAAGRKRRSSISVVTSQTARITLSCYTSSSPINQVLQNVEAIGCRKHLTPSCLVSGNPRLNLAFVANLFNAWPSLALLDEQEAKDYGAIEDFGAEAEREARAFTLWINSFGVEPAVFNLFENLWDRTSKCWTRFYLEAKRLCEDGRHHDRCYRVVSPNIMDEFFFLYYTTMAINCGEVSGYCMTVSIEPGRPNLVLSELYSLVGQRPTRKSNMLSQSSPSYIAHYWVLQRLKSNRKMRTRISEDELPSSTFES
ncbi:calponin homology domain-containing protein [Suillus ampliporus]|nr:calponin homology domain-containing protein [Suillus ampliporus]